MKKRPTRVLWSLLNLSVVVPFSVPVEAGPSHEGVGQVVAGNVDSVPKGNEVDHSISYSCNAILKIDSFHYNPSIIAMVSRDGPGLRLHGVRDCGTVFFHPFRGRKDFH